MRHFQSFQGVEFGTFNFNEFETSGLMVYGMTVNLDICNVCRPSYIEQFLILRQCIIKSVIVNVTISITLSSGSQQSVC